MQKEAVVVVIWIQEILQAQTEEGYLETPLQRKDISEPPNVPVVETMVLFQLLKGTNVIVVGEIVFVQNVP